MSNRKELKIHYLNLLERFSDEKFIDDVWVNGRYYDYVFSFDELVEMFEDFFFFDEMKSFLVEIEDPDQKSIIEKFLDRIEGYSTPSNPSELLSDKKFIEIKKLAHDVEEIIKKYY